MVKEHDMSIRCYYDTPGASPYTSHRRTMKWSDLEKWCKAYKLTHPMVKAISVRVWFNEDDAQNENDIDTE